jgi:hypothetical protein
MYTVRWKRTAFDRLTEIWLEAPDRSAVTAAVDEVDRLLAANPHEAGESRSDEIRVLFVAPVGVFFEVHDDSLVVDVLKVWTF